MLTVIMTGGASRRMGRDKAMLPVGENYMLQMLIDRYRAAFGDVIVSVNEAGRFAFHGALEEPDAYPNQGPLNGILSGFRHTEEDYIFITATDLPFGTPELACRLLELARGFDGCIISHGFKGIEPLFAVYRRTCVQAAKDSLEEGRKSFKSLFEKLNVRFVLPEELPEFDLDKILLNVNTPEEYKKMQSLL